MLGVHYSGHPAAQQLLPKIGNRIMELLELKELNALVNTIIELRDVPDALQKMKDGAGAFKGKTVVKL
jgi:hypothetical protein